MADLVERKRFDPYFSSRRRYRYGFIIRRGASIAPIPVGHPKHTDPASLA